MNLEKESSRGEMIFLYFVFKFGPIFIIPS